MRKGKEGLLFLLANTVCCLTRATDSFFFFFGLAWFGLAFPSYTTLWATLCATISKTVFYDEERLAMGMVLGIVYLVSNGDIKVG